MFTHLPALVDHKTPIANRSTSLKQAAMPLHRSVGRSFPHALTGTDIGVQGVRAMAKVGTCMLGLLRCPRLDVVCLGSCPNIIVCGFINLRYSTKIK